MAPGAGRRISDLAPLALRGPFASTSAQIWEE